MSYLTIAVPIAIQSIARRIAMAFEPDSGVRADTYDAFSTIALDDQGAEWCYYGAPVEDWVAESAPLWQHAPDQLRLAVKAYNDVRFPDEPDLNITSISKFTDSVKISTAYGTAAGLAEMGLSPKQDESLQ